jgi:D-alanine-D-alanine ligase
MRLAILVGDLDRDAALVPGSSLGEVDRTSFDALEAAVRELDCETTWVRSHASFIDDIRKLVGRVDLVLNLCDEGYANRLDRELHVPALLELLGLPYTGSCPRALAYCFDKALVRSAARDLGIPVAPAELHARPDRVASPSFGFPAIVKPNFGDGSLGITTRSVVHDEGELSRAVSELASGGYRDAVLVERYLEGDDVDVAAVGNRDAWTILPMTTVDYREADPGAPRIQSIEFKWLDASPYERTQIVRAALPERVETSISRWTQQVLDRLGVRDYARVDWRLDHVGEPHLLEVNPNTGWGASGRLADMAALSGRSYADLLRWIIEVAVSRSTMRSTIES